MEDRNDKVMAYRTFVQTLKKMRCKIAYGFRHRWQKRRVGNKHMDIIIYQFFMGFLAKIPSFGNKHNCCTRGLEINIIVILGGWK